MDNGKSRLQQAQDNVEEVKVIMMDNLNKSKNRTAKLGDLEVRGEVLLEKSKHFERKTKKVKERFWYENKKSKIILIVAGVIALLVIVGVIIYCCL